MAMDADDGGIAQRFHDAADEFAVFVGRGVADGIGNVDRAGSGRDHGLRNLFEIFGIGAGAVFGGEFDVIHISCARVRRRHTASSSTCCAGFLQLVLQMDVAGGEKGVDARAAGFLESLGGALDIELHASGRARPPEPMGIHG